MKEFDQWQFDILYHRKNLVISSNDRKCFKWRWRKKSISSKQKLMRKHIYRAV